jgi:hypothetical protein
VLDCWEMSVVRYVRLHCLMRCCQSVKSTIFLLPFIDFSFGTTHGFYSYFIYLFNSFNSFPPIHPSGSVSDTGRTHWGIGDRGGGHLLFLFSLGPPEVSVSRDSKKR